MSTTICLKLSIAEYEPHLKFTFSFLYLTSMENNTIGPSKFRSIALVLIAGGVLMASSIYAIKYSKEKARQEAIMERRATKLCQDLYKDAYDGVIVKAKKNHLRIRKLKNNKFKEFNYFFKKTYKVNQHFYAGQNLYKQANSENFSADMKSGERMEFNIPCWE